MSAKRIIEGLKEAIEHERTRPLRIQRRRAKGWRLPPNTVCVDRSTKWGNPFVVGRDGTRKRCVELFEALCHGLICYSKPANPKAQRAYLERAVKNIGELRGKNLACWCPLNAPCHADVLMRAANRTPLPQQQPRQQTSVE